MESPKSDGNDFDTLPASSPSAQKSPFSKFLNNLSPIKSANALRYTERLSDSNFPTTPSVFGSPQSDLQRESGFLKREEKAASNSNVALIPCIQKQTQNNLEVDSVQHAETCVQSANDVPRLLPSCYNTASEVTTEKADDTNDCVVEVGAETLPHLANEHLLSGSWSLVEVPGDRSIDERFDKVLKFSSENICNLVESDQLLEHHVRQEASQHQRGIRRHLQFEATLDCEDDAAFNCHASIRPRIGVPYLIEPQGSCKDQQGLYSSLTMAAHASFLASDSFSSTENGGDHAILARVPSHTGLSLNNVYENSQEKHILGSSNYLLEDIYDPFISTCREVVDHVDCDRQSSEAVVVDNTQQMSCFEQQTVLCDGNINDQQFAERVEELSQCQDSSKGKRKRETDESEGCKSCNCKRSKCLKLYCECFAAGIYCVDSCACENCFNKIDFEDTVSEIREQIESRDPKAFAPTIVNQANDSPNVADDGNWATTPLSARHKRGCKCKKSKCLKKYCECYRAKVGCCDGCRCECCGNSFGTKSDSIVPREEKWKNVCVEKPNMAGVMSNQLQPTWEEVVHMSHLTLLSPPHSRAVVHALTLPNMEDFPNNSQDEIGLHFSPAHLQWGSPPAHALGGLMGDDLPAILNDNSSPINKSPNQKRVSPPQLQSTPGLQKAHNLVLQALSSFPPQTENDQ